MFCLLLLLQRKEGRAWVSDGGGMATTATASASWEELTLKVKWIGNEYTVRVCADDTVGELKRRICELTNVLPLRQKLLYPKLGSKLNDDSLSLHLTN